MSKTPVSIIDLFRPTPEKARLGLVERHGMDAAKVAVMSDAVVVDKCEALDEIDDVVDPTNEPLYDSPANLRPAKPATAARVLLPDRYPQSDLSICDVLEAVPKDDLGSMEHPIFSLSKRPDIAIRRYEHNGVSVEVTPSVKGIATIFDKDILIYVISQLITKIDQNIEPHRTVRMRAYDFLVSTNRGTGGREYDLLEAAFERLAGTRLRTDIRTADERTRAGFGMIDSWKIVERRLDSRMDAIEVTVSEWLFRAIRAREVLTLHRDYFRLGSPIDRRLYELARKHCGRQPKWSIGLALLQKKAGSRSALKEFRQAIRGRVQSDHLPEYTVEFDDKGDMVTFSRRQPSTPGHVTSPTTVDIPCTDT